MSCPNCGAPGGGPAGCGSCGLGKDPNVGGAFNAGQDELRRQQNSKNDNGCFPGDSLILTPAGYKALSSLKKGDVVSSMDSNGNIVPVNIKRFDSHRPHHLVSVKSNVHGLSFRATKLHPVQTTRGWVPVKDLKVGDELVYVTDSGQQETHTVENVCFTDEFVPVYNLTVDGDHTFIVKGCVAHSFVSFRAFRCMLSKLLNVASYPLRLSASPV
jgi:hypothetical protein